MSYKIKVLYNITNKYVINIKWEWELFNTICEIAVIWVICLYCVKYKVILFYFLLFNNIDTNRTKKCIIWIKNQFKYLTMCSIVGTYI